MMSRITIDPITRLEGHGKIEIFLDDQGEVKDTHFVIPELRGFEVFSVGRPAEEMGGPLFCLLGQECVLVAPGESNSGS